MKSLLKISLFLFIALLSLPIYARAQAEPTASPSPSPNLEEVTENLKERLKNSVGNLEEINLVEEKLSLRGYIGTVTDIIQDTIVIADKSGKKNINVLTETTILRSPGNKEIDLDNVRLDDAIIAIGDPLSEDELDGKRLIVSEETFSPPEKLAGLATINKINRYSFDLTTSQGESLELFFTGKTAYKKPAKSLELADLAEGDEILFTAVKDKDDDWSATIVMQITPALPTSNPESTSPTE